jgi:AAA15 family ATPase/GTPase
MNMLLEFRTKNYKSFRDEMVFSMLPSPKQKRLGYSVLQANACAKQYDAICSAVIYGPNAAGKSNIFDAMDTFKKIVIRGNINNATDPGLNTASSQLELIPNFLSYL